MEELTDIIGLTVTPGQMEVDILCCKVENKNILYYLVPNISHKLTKKLNAQIHGTTFHILHNIFKLLSTSEIIVCNIAEVEQDSTSVCNTAWNIACNNFRDGHMMQFSHCE